jgi:tetratricopeptide (TPR) repeat protein
MILRRAAALLLLALACAHRSAAPGSTAVADPDRGGAREPQRYISARAYNHYLDGLLARNADDLVTAADELRQALLYDPESAYLHAVLADVLIKQARIADADVELASALSLDPRHGPAHLLSGRIAVSRNQPMQARDHFQAAIEAQPDDPDAYRELARLLLSTGEPQAAQAVAEKLGERVQRAQDVAADDDDALVAADRLREQAAATFVEMGRWWAQHDDDRAAERAFAQARGASPADPEALIAEATFLEARRKYADARERYLRLLAQRPESPEVIAALARVALAEGDVDAVTAHARKLLALAANLEPSDGAGGDPEDERRDVCTALLRVAVPLLGAHRSADAQVALEGALRLYPDHPELSFYRALALVQRGRPRDGALAFEAVERSMRARGGEPPSPAFLGLEPDALMLDAQVQSALARGRSGEAPESLRRLRLLFAEHPEEEGVALALLEAFDRSGKAAEAEQVLAASVRAHPETGALLYALASAQDRAGMRQKALSTMRKMLALQPQHAGALNYIGYTLTERGRPADLREAEDLLARAVELRPDDGAIADSYGFCLLKLGRPSEALAELRRADRLTPSDPVILSHLGDALLAAGKKEEALSAFRRALKLLLPGPRRRPSAAEARAMIDPPDRADRDGPRVRREIEKKLKALAP